MRVLSVVVGLIGVFTPQMALAWTCVADTVDPDGTRYTLEKCIAEAADGDIVELKTGVHRVEGLVITQAITIRPAGAARARIGFGGTILASRQAQVREDKGEFLLPDARLLLVDAPDKTVRIEGVNLVPHVFEGDLVSGALEIQRGTLELTDVSLAEGPFQFAQKTEVSQRQGGALARVSTGAELILGEGVAMGPISGPQVDGALVYASGAEARVSVSGDVLINNIESYRGAIHADDGATVSVSAAGGQSPRFLNCRAQHGAALFGGNGSTIQVNAGEFARNSVPYDRSAEQGYGGHISVENSTLTVDDGHFHRGTASYGGAFGARDSQVTISGGLFHDGPEGGNRARRGGIIAAVAEEGSGFLTLDRVDLAHGLAVFAVGDEGAGRNRPAGGAVFAQNLLFTMSGGSLTENQTGPTGVGGGLSCDGCVVDVVEAEIAQNVAALGAGAHLHEAKGELTSVRIVSNGDGVRTLVGGGLVSTFGGPSMTELTVGSNTARVGGGLALIGGGDFVVDGGTIENNLARQGAGLVSVAPSLVLNGVTVARNIAASTDGESVVGGGLLVSSRLSYDGELIDLGESSLTLNDGVVRENRADSGGGIWAFGVTTTLAGTQVVGNIANDSGGGIASDEGSLTLRQATLLDNAAQRAGGAVVSRLASVSALGSSFLGNTADTGAALALTEFGQHVLSNNRICGNVAFEAGVVAIDVPTDTPQDELVTFANNLVDGAGGGLGSALVLVGGIHEVEHNHFIGGGGLVVQYAGEQLDFHHNMVHWGESGAVLQSSAGALALSRNLFWREGAIDVIAEDYLGGPLTLAEEVLVAHPHLRGFLNTQSTWTEGARCNLVGHHPRPNSPLLSGWPDGYPTTLMPDHIGIYGGTRANQRAWLDDNDGDSTKAIFDCDDDNKEIGDREPQFQDNDGDGLGGEPWPGDECDFIEGNQRESLDCDDSNPVVGEDCGDVLSYYGSRCSTVDPRTAGFAGLVLVGFGLSIRRRRGGFRLR